MLDLNVLVGGEVLQSADQDVDFGYNTPDERPTPVLYIRKGRKVYEVVIMSDPEGNGPGFVNIEHRKDLS